MGGRRACARGGLRLWARIRRRRVSSSRAVGAGRAAAVVGTGPGDGEADGQRRPERARARKQLKRDAALQLSLDEQEAEAEIALSLAADAGEPFAAVSLGLPEAPEAEAPEADGVALGEEVGAEQQAGTSGGLRQAMVRMVEQRLDSPLSTAPQYPPPGPLVVVISGPSGVGKDSVLRKLQERRPDLHFVVTATSRAMRPGEEDGVDYHFVTKESFEAMIAEGELIEHALVYGEYKGIPKQQVRDALASGRDVVLRLDVQGAATVRELIPDAVSIFIVAESEAALAARLIARKTEPLEKLIVRVQTAREETTRLNEFGYVVVNREGELDRAVDELCAVFDAEKLRVKQSCYDDL